MKISIDRNLLEGKLSLAARFIPSRFSSLSSLQGTLLEAKEGELNIYSTNLNSYFHTKIKIKEKVSFKKLTDPRKIIEFLSLIMPGDISLEVSDKEIIISQGKTSGSFPIIAYTEFPQPPVLKEKAQKLKTEFFVRDIPLVLFSASTDETRPVLTGVNFLAQDESMLVVATDGFRLSFLKTKKNQVFPQMLLPRDFLTEIIRLIKDEKEIEFAFSKQEKTAVIRCSEGDFYTRLIEGEFPPFEKVIPADKTATVTTDREELIRNIKTTAVFARDFSNIVLCEFKQDGLYLKPKLDTAGKSQTFQEARLDGEEQTVAFNLKFLLDFLNQIDSKTVIIEVLRPDAPVVFKADNKPDFIHIIMPIRIQQ